MGTTTHAAWVRVGEDIPAGAKRVLAVAGPRVQVELPGPAPKVQKQLTPAPPPPAAAAPEDAGDQSD